MMKTVYAVIFINEYGIRALRRFMGWEKNQSYQWFRFYKKINSSAIYRNSDIIDFISNKI